MRRALVLALPALLGCNELVDLGRFVIDEDAGPPAASDGGGLDASRPDGGCTPATYYRDSDMDGAGDPETTMLACERPDGYVDVAGDCDDTDMAILPGADELCDGVDQDCDTAIDEGLGEMQPPIEIAAAPTTAPEEQLYFGSMASFDGGVAVVYRDDGDGDGDPLTYLARTQMVIVNDAGVITAGPTTLATAPASAGVMLFETDGLQQLLVFRTTSTDLSVQLIPTTGETNLGSALRVAIDPEFVGAARQIGDRIVMRRLGVGGSLNLSNFDPVTGVVTSTLTIPAPVGALDGDWLGFATTVSPEPTVLLTSFHLFVEPPDGGVPDGGTLSDFARSSTRIYRVPIRPGGILEWSDDPAHVMEPDLSDTCASLGRTSCPGAVRIEGRGDEAGPLALFELVGVSFDDDRPQDGAACVRAARVVAGTPWLETSDCTRLSTRQIFAVDVHPTRGTALFAVGGQTAVRELPLFPRAGSDLVSIPDYSLEFTNPGLEARGTTVWVAGRQASSDRVNLAVWPFRCSP